MEKPEETPAVCPYPGCSSSAAEKLSGFCAEHQIVMERFVWMLGHVQVQGRPLLEVIGTIAQSLNNAQTQALAAKLRPQLHSPNGGLLRR